MWIFTTKGFFSIVETKEDPDQVLIRARIKKDIQNMKDLFDALGLKSTKILVGSGSDYKYRFTADRMDWIAAMTRLMLDLRYNNFKDAVYESDSHEMRERRRDAYFDIWAITRNLQSVEK
jgi:hypothetical protein